MEHSLTNIPTKASRNNSSNSMIIMKLNENQYRTASSTTNQKLVTKKNDQRSVRKHPVKQTKGKSLFNIFTFLTIVL